MRDCYNSNLNWNLLCRNMDFYYTDRLNSSSGAWTRADQQTGFMLHGNSNSLTFACQIIKYFHRTVTKKNPNLLWKCHKKISTFCIKMSKQNIDSSCYVSKCQFGIFLSVFWLYLMCKFYLEFF